MGSELNSLCRSPSGAKPIHPTHPGEGDAQYSSVLGLTVHFSVFPYNNIEIHSISLTLSGWTLTFWRILSTAGQYFHGVL